MSIFDKNADRIRGFKNKLKKGGLSKDQIKSLNKAIASREALGSEWWICYRDHQNKRKCEKAGNGKSKRLAKQLERKRRNQVDNKEII